jgi:hypothetical protein
MNLNLAITVGFYFAIFGFSIVTLLPIVRRHYKDNSKYEINLHFLVITRQICLFLMPLMFSIAFIGTSFAFAQLTSLIVLGLSINVFWFLQMPSLTMAHIAVDYSVDGLTNFNDKGFSLKVNNRHTVYVRIYNLGFSALKNSSVIVYFQKGVNVLPSDDVAYEGIDFAKEFHIQKCQCGALFSPTKNFQSIPQKEWFLFPIIVNTQSIPLKQEITVLFGSENSWGQKRLTAQMTIS